MSEQTSPFSVETFLGSTVEAELSTRPVVLPKGEYLGLTGQPAVRQSQGKKETNRGVTYTFLEIPIEIQIPPELQEEMLRKTTRLTHSISLDLTDSGALDARKGANWRLGQFLEAINVKVPWSPSDLSGKMVSVTVKHEIYEGEPQARIESVGKAN